MNQGDLVINKMKAWQGSLGISKHTGITSPDYVVYSPCHHENGRFLHHFLRNRLLANVYLTISNGIRPSQWRLEPEKFEDLVVFIPPNIEQAAICEYIDSETKALDKLTERVEMAAHLLKELRTTLISAAVTGKIDVRAPEPSPDDRRLTTKIERSPFDFHGAAAPAVAREARQAAGEGGAQGLRS